MNDRFEISTLNLIDTIKAAKAVARRYYELTGKPLGVTGEIGEVIGADLLGLKLAEVRQAGFDAIGPDNRRVQIKSRCILPEAKSGQVGAIKLDHQWDTVALVLMDLNFDPLEIHEATRKAVKKALTLPGSKA